MPVGSDVRKLAAVMFTDIVGYTAMVQQDEAHALEKVRIHRKYLEDLTKQYQGQVIQFYGDGSLSIYDSVVDAVRCAIAMQHGYQGEDKVPVRIGIHLGDFVIKDGTVFGDGVNIASRIQAEGIPGGVLISEKVNQELANHGDIDTVFLGPFELKNVSQPINVYAVATEGLVVPTSRPKPVLTKNRVLKFLIPFTVVAVAYGAVQFFQGTKSADDILREERIAVPAFEDFTNDPEYSTVAKMASHWITTELIESVHASVVSYQSAVENTQVSYASVGPKRYSGQTGAVNVIEGAYQFRNKDTLEFSAIIRNLESGDGLKAISGVTCPASDPMQCIQELSNKLKGLWVSRTDHVLKPPKYDAYKEYLQARAVWIEDPDAAQAFLEKSIGLDPEFIDAYFLLLDWYYNRGQYSAVATQIEEMKTRFDNLTERQDTYLKYYDADNKGHNVAAFNYFLKEYQIDPKDLFVNTSGMVMANEYVNAPDKAVEFFNQIDPDSLNLDQCGYCRTRFVQGIHAYLHLGKNRKARNLADKLSSSVQEWKTYKGLIEFYVATNDTSRANVLLSKAMTKVEPRYRPYLYFIAGRQALLNRKPELRDLYGNRAVQLSPDSTRMLARSLYLMDDLDAALASYKNALALDSTDNQIYAEMGVIYARQNDTEAAERMIRKLGDMKPSFDYGYTPYCQGRIAAILGDKTRAFGLFRQALDEGARFRSSIDFTQDPDLMMLRDDPVYRDMLDRLPG